MWITRSLQLFICGLLTISQAQASHKQAPTTLQLSCLQKILSSLGSAPPPNTNNRNASVKKDSGILSGKREFLVTPALRPDPKRIEQLSLKMDDIHIFFSSVVDLDLSINSSLANSLNKTIVATASEYLREKGVVHKIIVYRRLLWSTTYLEILPGTGSKLNEWVNTRSVRDNAHVFFIPYFALRRHLHTGYIPPSHALPPGFQFLGPSIVGHQGIVPFGSFLLCEQCIKNVEPTNIFQAHNVMGHALVEEQLAKKQLSPHFGLAYAPPGTGKFPDYATNINLAKYGYTNSPTENVLTFDDPFAYRNALLASMETVTAAIRLNRMGSLYSSVHLFLENLINGLHKSLVSQETIRLFMKVYRKFPRGVHYQQGEENLIWATARVSVPSSRRHQKAYFDIAIPLVQSQGVSDTNNAIYLSSYLKSLGTNMGKYVHYFRSMVTKINLDAVDPEELQAIVNAAEESHF